MNLAYQAASCNKKTAKHPSDFFPFAIRILPTCDLVVVILQTTVKSRIVPI